MEPGCLLSVCLHLHCFVSPSTPSKQGNLDGVGVAGEQSGVPEGKHKLV